MKKCYCKYTEDGKHIGLCLRCFKMEVKAANRERAKIVILLDKLFPRRLELYNSKIRTLRERILEGE